MDHVSSGSCQALGSSLCPSLQGNYHNTMSSDLETHILQFALKKGNIGKRSLKQILVSRHIEFSDDDGISCLRKLLRSHVMQLRKGKWLEWSHSLQSEAQHKHDERLEEIRSNWL